MGRKIFAVSDVHGYCTELLAALQEAGFDQNDENHLFVSCGDLFDRGQENRRVYDFVKSLPRKILIKGNHEESLSTVLKEGKITETETSNGTDITIAEILGMNAVDENGCIDRIAYAEKIRELTDFVDSMLDYYETETYVFTHGWVPVVFAEDTAFPTVSPLWRQATEEEWSDARWMNWYEFYAVKATIAGKILVCGHRPAWMGRMFDDRREPDCSEPFRGNGVIAIDAMTKDSGRVNVLVIETEA